MPGQLATMPFNLGLARLLHLILLSSTLVVSQCPTTTEGVNPQILSACSVLASSISAQIAAGATSVGGVITFSVPPIGSSGKGKATKTSVISSTSLKRSSGVGSPSTASSTTSTMSTPSSSGPASSSTGVAASMTGSTGASASNSNNHHYRDTVIIPAAVVGSVVGAILIVLLLWFCLRRRRKQSKDASDSGGSGAALNASPEVNDEKAYPAGAGSNGVNDGSYAPAFGAAGAGAGLAAGVYGSSSNETESRSPMAPYRTADSAGPNANREMGTGGESYGPAAAAVGAGAGLGAAGYGAARDNQSSTGSSAVPYMSAGSGAGNNNGATTPASGNRSGATSPSSGRYPTSSPRLSGDQTAPWAAQPLRHFRRASRGELTAQDGQGPTADLADAAALSSSQPIAASQEPEAEYLAVPGGDDNHAMSSEDSPGLDDIEEASIEDTASYYTEARQSQGDLIGAARSGSDSRLYSADTTDPAHAQGTWLESPRSSDLAKSYGAYQQPLPYSDEARTPTQTMPGSFYDPYSTEEAPTPPRQQPSNPLKERYLQQQTQSANRPTSTASSGLWSGATEESEQWWNSGVPAVGHSEGGSDPRFSGSRASGGPSFVGTGEVGTGTARVIEGPWRGANTSISSQSAVADMARGTGGSGRGSIADTLDRGNGGNVRTSGDVQSATGGASTRMSIPRKPVGVSEHEVGIAR